MSSFSINEHLDNRSIREAVACDLRSSHLVLSDTL
jgi:hypothetical protein